MPDEGLEETVFKLLEAFSESLIDDDAVWVEQGGDPLAHAGPPSVVADEGGDPYAKDEKSA